MRGSDVGEHSGSEWWKVNFFDLDFEIDIPICMYKVLGSHTKCFGFTPGYVLRNYSWWCSEAHMGCCTGCVQGNKKSGLRLCYILTSLYTPI